MKVKLIRPDSGLGKSGDVVEVDAVRGNDMACKGECDVMEHDKPDAVRAAPETVKVKREK